MTMDLFEAIAYSDLDAVKNILANAKNAAKLLEEERKCEAYGPAAECAITPLKFAIYYASPEVIEVLINAGAKVNRTYREGLSALNLAAHVDRVDVAEVLLKNGAKPNIVSCGAQPIMYATSGEMTELLIQKGAYLGETASVALSSAVYNCQNDKANVLLSHKVKVNRPRKNPPLLSAIQNPNVSGDMFRTLLEHGANPNFYTTSRDGGRSLLHHCLERLCEPTLTRQEADVLHQKTLALLDYGADVNALNELGETPLVSAAWMDSKYSDIQQSIVEKMIEKNANVRYVCGGHSVWEHYKMSNSAGIIAKKLNELSNTRWNRFVHAITGRKIHQYA